MFLFQISCACALFLIKVGLLPPNQVPAIDLFYGAGLGFHAKSADGIRLHSQQQLPTKRAGLVVRNLFEVQDARAEPRQINTRNDGTHAQRLIVLERGALLFRRHDEVLARIAHAGPHLKERVRGSKPIQCASEGNRRKRRDERDQDVTRPTGEEK